MHTQITLCIYANHTYRISKCVILAFGIYSSHFDNFLTNTTVLYRVKRLQYFKTATTSTHVTNNKICYSGKTFSTNQNVFHYAGDVSNLKLNQLSNQYNSITTSH